MAGKIITIDWPTIAALPSDEYHIKLLSKQQAAVLQALCEYQHWQTRWDNLELSQDELDKFMGDIEFRLMGDETGGFMTVDELIEGICGGLVCAAPKIGAMLATGVTTGFTIDDEGNVTTPDEGGVDVPEDDPTTPEYDEAAAARAGGVIVVTNGIQEILTNMYNWKQAGVITDVQAALRLELLYNYDPNDASAFASYWWNVYANSQGTVPINLAIVQSNFFCKGLTMNSFTEYIYENHAVALEVPVLEKFVQYFPVSQLDVWYQKGVLVPSTAYRSYSCTMNKVEQWTLNFSTAESFTLPISQILKTGHRFLIEAVGSFVDADVPNEVQDFFWKRNTATGVNTFTGFTLSVSGTSPATAAQVPYESSHAYAWTFDKVGDDGGTITKTNDSFTNPNVTGTIILTLTDLGEFAL